MIGTYFIHWFNVPGVASVGRRCEAFRRDVSTGRTGGEKYLPTLLCYWIISFEIFSCW